MVNGRQKGAAAEREIAKLLFDELYGRIGGEDGKSRLHEFTIVRRINLDNSVDGRGFFSLPGLTINGG